MFYFQAKEIKPTVPICTDPDAVTSQEEENDIIKGWNDSYIQHDKDNLIT